MDSDLMSSPDVSGTAVARPRRLLIIHNPAAGRNRKKRLAAVLERLDRLGCAYTLRETGRRGDAERFAAEVSPADFDAVVCAGGDGTINEVVNGLLAGPGGLALGIIPLGTANVLACEIGLDPGDAEQIARAIAFGPGRAVHPGTANRRHFMVMAGAGLDAHVVAGVNLALKRHAGKLAYVVESVRQAFGYDFPRLTIRADGREYEAAMIVACRARHYGGPFIAAPRARLDAPRLEVCVLPRSGVAGMLRYGLALPLNKLPELPEVTMVSASSITICGPRDAPVQGDGDIVARLPAEIAVAEETVDLIMPEAA